MTQRTRMSFTYWTSYSDGHTAQKWKFLKEDIAQRPVTKSDPKPKTIDASEVVKLTFYSLSEKKFKTF